MPLTPGTKFGPYEVVSALGSGGMGEVYRARDTRLQREVALKILPEQFSTRADLRERFEQEAKSISSLQHPNICTLHDIGNQSGVDYLILELVEGETLDKRLERGPLPLEQVLRYGAEMAQALDAAHRRGIVHRDLKPGNMMLTKSGAKLLDFGLARQTLEAPSSNSALTQVDVESRKLTAEGTLVGTFQYMAPEQLESKEADARSDIFALGTVIYEMVTGKAAFAGKSTASLIAAILSSEPAPISTLQPTPPALERVVKRCLAKDPDERWQSAADLANELKWIGEGGASSSTDISAPVVARRKKRERLAWIAAGIFAVLALTGGLLYFGDRGAVAPSIQAYLPPPNGTSYSFNGDNAGLPVISPDGLRVAFAASDEQGTPLLWVRSLSDGSVRSLPGTALAAFPFWSFDGKNLGYFTGGKLMRVAINGGSPVALADANNARGGSWGPDDTILFAPSSQTPIYRISASGGSATPVTQIDTKRHTTHRWPFLLPDGKHFLYLAGSHTRPHADLDEIYVASVDGKENRLLTAATSNAIAVPGYMIFIQNQTLVAQPFDTATAKLSGEPMTIAENVHFEEGNWHGVFDCAPQGPLIYQASTGAQGSQLLWYARDGRILSKLGDVDRYRDLSLSPDDRKLVVLVGDPASSLWLYDLPRGLRTRITFNGIGERSPAFSPDGNQIAFMRALPGGMGSSIFVRDVNGAGTEKELFGGDFLKLPTSWAPDGKHILYTQTPVGFGVWLLSLGDGEAKSQPFLPPQLSTTDAQFSPDGHWVAYTSQESGRTEIYVTQFPGPRGKWQISTKSGRTPRWRRDGKAIYYWAQNHTLMEAQVELGPSTLQVLATHPLFRATMPIDPIGTFTYDVTRDGQKFIVNATTASEDQPLTVVTNWTAKLKKK